MKILSININEFGGLKDFSLELSDSLNVIRGDNESGKSTILLFISYILYGLSKSSKKNTPDAYDKQRALSWSSSRAAGSMEIEDKGIRYRIERENVRRSSSSEAVITDIDAGVVVHSGRVPGEVFLGVSKETFESCLWCGQLRTAAINSQKLSETLSNLSLTADESINGDAVLSALREARKQYKHERGNGGRIFEAEEKITEASVRASRINAAINEGFADRERYEKLNGKKEELKEKLDKAEKKKNAISSLKILARMRSLREFEATIAEDKKALLALEKNSDFGGETPNAKEYASLNMLMDTYKTRKDEYEKAKAKISESSADSQSLGVAEKLRVYGSAEGFCNSIKQRLALLSKQRVLAAVCGLFALVAAIGGALSLASVAICVVLFALCALGTILAAVSLSSYLRKSREIKDELASVGTDAQTYEKHISRCFTDLAFAENAEREIEKSKANLEFALAEIDKVLDRYGRETGEPLRSFSALLEDVSEYLNAKNALWEKISLNEKIAQRDRELLKNYNEEELRADIPDFVSEDAKIDESAAELEYREMNGAYKALENELVELKIKIESSGADTEKLADVKREIELLQLQRDELTERYNILNRAYEAIDEAYLNMRRNFAPRVRDGAGKYLEAISGGKYSRVFLSEDFELSVEHSGSERASGTLSTGTSDALYMALRLSLVDNIFECEVPLFMDETLASLDDRRASALLSIAAEFVGAGNQCLLFSCHKREAELCEQLGIDFNLIEL